jgi:hypothetical protein
MVTPSRDRKHQQVIADMDAWRAAGILIGEYGEDAEQRADALFGADEVAGYRFFAVVVKAIIELRRTKRKEGERMN